MSMQPSTIDNIRKSLVGLRMPRALEALDATLRRIEQGEIDGIQAFDELLVEELTLRESRRIKAALMMARLTTIKTLADIIASLLVVDEIGYLPVVPGGGNLFFQLVNARYEKGAMILTSNRGFAEWGEVFGDPVVATALLDGLLHHAVVLQIEGSSYRLRQHADLVPEHVRSKALINPPPPPKKRGRPAGVKTSDQDPG